MTNTVYVEVPADFADEVRRFTAFLVADRRHAGVVPSSTADNIADYPLWADEEIVALANSGTVTSRVYRRIMDSVTEHGVGKWVSIPELAEWTEQPSSVISTFRTHLYRYINAHLPEGTVAPFTRASGQDLRPARGRGVYYRVSQACADQWNRVQPELTAL